jgi:hypothetical protein
MRALVLALVLSAAPALALADGVTVTNLAGAVTTLSPSQLADLPQGEATLHEGAKATPYQGATLTAILREAGVPVGPRAHGAPMHAVVVVRGSDGYRITLSLAETDPEFRTGPIVLAGKKAGAPLDPREGPLRLVIGDDLKPWRAVKHVVAIDVKSVD